MFFEQLKKACKMNDISPTKVITEIGQTQSNVTNWKKGIMPNSEIVIKLAKRLNVTTDFLLMENEESNKEVSLIEFLDEEEKEILCHLNKLNEKDKIRLLTRVEMLVEGMLNKEI
jgi:transcriptional regulator with XRE-family HTH domain